jgi:hypothetical protein
LDEDYLDCCSNLSSDEEFKSESTEADDSLDDNDFDAIISNLNSSNDYCGNDYVSDFIDSNLVHQQ